MGAEQQFGPRSRAGGRVTTAWRKFEQTLTRLPDMTGRRALKPFNGVQQGRRANRSDRRCRLRTPAQEDRHA